MFKQTDKKIIAILRYFFCLTGPIFRCHCYGHHYTMLLNMSTTSGLMILIHGVVSLPDVTSYDAQRTIWALNVINDVTSY